MAFYSTRIADNTPQKSLMRLCTQTFIIAVDENSCQSNGRTINAARNENIF